MKKSDIYEVAIKILGLYTFVTVIGTIRDLLTTFTMLSAAKQNAEGFGDFNQTPFLLISIFNFAMLTFFASILTFKTKGIVKKICPPSDYEETANLFAGSKVIYEIAIRLTGFLLILWTLPEFAFKLSNHFKIVQSGMLTDARDNNYLISSLIKIVFGLFAILTAKSVAEYFAKDNLQKEEK